MPVSLLMKTTPSKRFGSSATGLFGHGQAAAVRRSANRSVQKENGQHVVKRAGHKI
ncbi:hypothetical protein TRICHSKD4_6217 [Roseibium sp. TrichSKD4]|nr:hypothetical protein TRICHSKD4_6217 [Roseibium sp. TrichSKD4]